MDWESLMGCQGALSKDAKVVGIDVINICLGLFVAMFVFSWSAWKTSIMFP